MNVERKTYQQILDKLKDLDSWLSALGLSNRADRIRLHISNIRKLEEARENGTLKKLAENRGNVQLMWSLIEAMEFADIYIHLRNYKPNILQKKLRAALKGPADPCAEITSSSSNIGRNTMFELNLAGRLHCQGIPVYLETNPDILCNIGLAKIHIQCKRPFFENNIPRNISAARRQLTRDLNNSNDHSARGVVAISVSRTLNPGDKLFVVKTEHDLIRLADNVQAIAQKHSDSWKRIVDTRIIGILFHLITPAFVEDISLLTAAQQIDIFSLALSRSSDELLLHDLKTLFSRANPSLAGT